MTVPPAKPLTGTGLQLEAMSRPSSAGAGGGGLGGGKAGGGKHGGPGGATSAAAAAAGAVAGSGSAAACLLPSAGLPGQPAELTALFECPVCFDYVLPPILQCQAGHLVCNPCRQKLSCCPTCRGPLSPSIRNLAMEKVASALPFPCKVTTGSVRACLLTGSGADLSGVVLVLQEPNMAGPTGRYMSSSEHMQTDCLVLCASMLCPASCLPLLRELAQWRCLLGWHRHHGVGSSSGATASASQQQGSEVRDRNRRPVGRTRPLPGSQVSPGETCFWFLVLTNPH
ncbi:cysteine and histidine-rich protein 1 homolog [Nematolebias whitei]|uniref:cysteine and histidine-rich protein 1 homolog n=1 Tax=Nematolebias whitei TaxID=451745 RepID=UPI0018976451|nr:cysteine and histidine-rich protein 1 homolog [Nematolebias whitei]